MSVYFHMNKIELQQGTYYYYDQSDPVVDALKQGYLFGANNWNLMKNLRAYYPTDGIVVDVGAHIGTFSYEALSSDERFILIEADETNCQCLRETFKDRDNVSIVEALVSNKKGRADFSERRGPFGWIEFNKNGKYETSTLDEILKNEKVGILKIDIEGSEILCLEGAVKTIEQRPLMLIEVNGYCLMQQEKCSNHLLQKIDSLDYNMYVVMNNTLFKVDPECFFPFCVVDVMCIPKEIDTKTNSVDLTQEIAENVYAQLKMQYNGDCQRYFEWLGAGCDVEWSGRSDRG